MGFSKAFAVLALLGVVSPVESKAQFVTFSEFQKVKIDDQYIYDALRKPRIIEGQQAFNFPGPAGLFCKSATDIHLSWNAIVEDARIVVENEGSTAFELFFGPSTISASGYVRDGLTCGWNGGELDTHVEGLFVRFSLVPQEGKNNPSVSFDKLAFKGLNFQRIAVGSRDGWKIQGDSPQWLDNWIGQNINVLLEAFFVSPLKKQLDSFLTAELDKQLNGRDPPVVEPLILGAR